MKLKDSPKCVACSEIESIEHLLYLCSETQLFWKSLSNWINTCLNMSIELSEVDVLFGISGNKSKEINFVIIHAKWFIYKTKLREQEPFLLTFLIDLKYNLKIEYFIERLKMKETNIWDTLYWAVCNGD